MNTTKKRSVAAVIAATLVMVLGVGVAMAWPSPNTTATGGACTGGTRSPITWTVKNLESGNKGSPATITNVKVSQGTISAFTPQPLPNTGSATATAQSSVDSSFAGTVTMTYTMVWSGTSGSDSRTGSASIEVSKCVAPPTTAPPTTTPPPTVPPTTQPPVPPTPTTAPPAAPTAPAAPIPAPPVVITPSFTG